MHTVRHHQTLCCPVPDLRPQTHRKTHKCLHVSLNPWRSRWSPTCRRASSGKWSAFYSGRKQSELSRENLFTCYKPGTRYLDKYFILLRFPFSLFLVNYCSAEWTLVNVVRAAAQHKFKPVLRDCYSTKRVSNFIYIHICVQVYIGYYSNYAHGSIKYGTVWEGKYQFNQP